MKSISVREFINGYPKLIENARRRHEEIIVLRRNLPYMKIVPLKAEVSYVDASVKQNPAPRFKGKVKGKGKGKGKRFVVPYLIN